MTDKNNSKPNIVFILSDDQGAWAMGCSGNKEIITPNLDRLAAQGIRFSSFFCTSPVCSPARASILTGRIPSQHGIHDWLAGNNMGEEAIEFLKGQTGYTDILADNGYTCGLSGKWHLGDSIKPQKSFSHWFAHQKGGGPYHNAPMIRDGVPYNDPGYVTDIITDDAVEFIEGQKNEGKPFYLSVHYTAPHSPWIGQHPEEFLALYENCIFETCPQESLHPNASDLTKSVQGKEIESLKGYFASITAMDKNIGRIIDKLEELKLRDNTLICFFGDNGFSCGQHGFWGKGNGTYPMNMYESSVKVPAIMSHPGKIPQGVVCEEMLSQYDIMPTLLEYAGVKVAGSMNSCEINLPGKSFSSILEGKETKGREHVVVYDEYGPVRMVRTKEWKYIHRYPYGPHELYDLINDPGERTNLYGDLDKEYITAELKYKLEEWFVRYVDPALDGTHEPVTGKGQIDLAGPAGNGRKAFVSLKKKNDSN